MLNALLQDVVQLALSNRPYYHAETRLPAGISKALLIYSWWQYSGFYCLLSTRAGVVTEYRKL